jgi:hypothetical protein
MNVEDIKRKLAEAGIKTGEGWADHGPREVRSPLVEKQRENLQKLEVLLEQQIEQDKMKLSELHVALTRLKHGGSQ